MGLSPYVVLGSAVVGLLVGLTGAGGGALMTPMLILLFNVKPEAAISSDLVAAVVMRPVGSLVHVGKGTVNFRLVGWMCAGSVPTAFLGAWLLHELGSGAGTQRGVERALGAALLAGTAAMVLRSWLDSRSGRQRTATVKGLTIRPVLTVLIGAVGGLVVGMTSVGSGSLMIVLLLFGYPLISARQLIGTDLTQAVPLTAAAALGALAFGHVELGVTTAVVLGSVPAVLIGSLLSSRAPDRYIRPVITFVIFASGLKYAGLGTTELGWTLCAVALAAAGWWLVRARSRSLRRGEPPARRVTSVISPDDDDLPDPRDANPQYALPLVIRVERATPPTRTDALECAARAVLVLLADPRAAEEDGEWAPSIRAWTDGRIRKVVRRARGAAWERAAELPGITVTLRSAEVRVYPPVPVDDWRPELARLQVSGTDFSDPESPPPPPSSSPVLWITPEVPMTAGKAMAQVGHAAQLAWLRLSARERTEWAEAGFDLAVRTASPARWRELLASGLPVVRDGGFTEVAPGSQTVIADLPVLRVPR